MLHEWSIDAREYARHEARRGRRHAYDQIDPRRTALVVIAASAGDGPPRTRVSAEFDVDAIDVVMEKSGVSAFFPGRCELPERLRDRNVDTVLITGTVANVCCESSARDASTLGYRVIMVADANAAMRDQDLNSTLHTIYRSFGDVRTTDDVAVLIDPRRALAGRWRSTP